jgi:hypothetical protein
LKDFILWLSDGCVFLLDHGFFPLSMQFTLKKESYFWYLPFKRFKFCKELQLGKREVRQSLFFAHWREEFLRGTLKKGKKYVLPKGEIA